jgi:hypothetical protein
MNKNISTKTIHVSTIEVSGAHHSYYISIVHNILSGFTYHLTSRSYKKQKQNPFYI